MPPSPTRSILIALAMAGLLSGPALAADDDDAPAKAKPAAEAAEPEDGVKIDAPTQARLGITTARLTAARSAVGGTTAFVKVVDPAPLLQADADIVQAQAALAASQSQAERARALNANGNAVATKEAEAAQAVARSDQARLTLARRQLVLAWGPAIGNLSDERRAALIDSLAAGRTALVRIDSLGGAGQGGGAVGIEFQGLPAMTAAVLGPARSADPSLASPGLLAEVSGGAAGRLSVGLTGTARLGAGSTSGGVLIPRGALVRRSGGTFVYIRTAPDRFERRAVVGAVFRTDGVFAPSGFKVGEEIAVTGGGALLGAELGAPEGDDD